MCLCVGRLVFRSTSTFAEVDISGTENESEREQTAVCGMRVIRLVISLLLGVIVAKVKH